MALPSLATLFGKELDSLVDKYRDQGLTYGEVIGAMECAKGYLIHEMMNDNDEEESPDA